MSENTAPALPILLTTFAPSIPVQLKLLNIVVSPKLHLTSSAANFFWTPLWIAFDALTFALSWKPPKVVTPTAAKIPIIATTTNNSINVKALFLNFISSLLYKYNWKLRKF